MTPEHQVLLTALAEFVSGASVRAAELAGLADREAAQAMANRPTAQAVRQAVTAAARANAYLVDEDRPTAGRSFDDRMLHRLGIAGLLRSGHPFDQQALVGQIAGYLAGPPEPLCRYVVLDLEWTQPEPMEIAGWHLHQPAASEWQDLRPIPAAAEYAAEDTWDPLLSFGEHLVLSAPDENEEAAAGHRIFWFPRMEESFEEAWLPLLLLNLWNDDPVRPVAEYLVEAHRVVDRVYASIPSRYIGDEGEYEVPQLGPLSIADADSPRLARFLMELSTGLAQWQAGSPANRRFDRLRRSAMRFLATGGKVAYDSTVFYPGDRPQVILNYVSALENLLSMPTMIRSNSVGALPSARLSSSAQTTPVVRRYFARYAPPTECAAELRMVQIPTKRNSRLRLRTCGLFFDEP